MKRLKSNFGKASEQIYTQKHKNNTALRAVFKREFDTTKNGAKIAIFCYREDRFAS